MRELREQLPKPFWFWLLVIVVWFFGMLLFKETLWNAVAELWGVMGAGAVFWFVSEHFSESIQRRAWLRKHAPYSQMVLDRLVDNAGMAARVTLNLPDDLHQQLTRGATCEQRRRAALEARQYVARVARSGMEDTEYLEDTLNGCIAGFEQVLNQHGGVLDRFAELQASLHACVSNCRFVATFPMALQEGLPEVSFLRYLTTRVPSEAGEAALAICEKSAAILVESGRLPAR